MISKKFDLKSTTIFFILFVCMIAFQNCARLLEASSNQKGPYSDQTLACFANPAVDACIYLKSATSLAAAGVDVGAASEYQINGVILQELDVSGSLQSPSFIINSNLGRAQKVSGTWKFSFISNPNELSQVAAFYYLTDFKNYFKVHTGIFPAQNHGIKVNIDSGLAGWTPDTNEINLQIQDYKIPMALDAGIVVNLLAHANAYYASTGLNLSNINTQSKTCANIKGARIPNTCCISIDGCGPALTAGQADYMTAVYFSSLSTINSPTSLGESWAFSVGGVSVCDVSRDVEQNFTLKVSQAYNACSSYGSNGNIYAMGALYASMWWELRKKATNKDNFDLFFLRHTELIRGDDTFETIKTKILALDVASFSSQYSAAINLEYQRRGL